MKPKVSPRIRTFTFDTAKFLAYICNDAVDLTRHLLSNGNDYEMLNCFFTDALEKAFRKLRQGSGGYYFVTVQTVVEKISIQISNTTHVSGP